MEQKQLNTKQCAGFTLIELLTVLAIGGILVAMAYPTFRETLERNRGIADVNEISSLIAYMRSEASKNQIGTVTFCVATDITADSVECSTNSTALNGGWAVFSDLGGDGLDAKDPLLKVGKSSSSNFTLAASGFQNNNLITFDSTGSPGSAGTITLCNGKGAVEAKAIIVSVAGLSRHAISDSVDGVVLDHNGDEVVCPTS
ncbi:hypothetical protein A9Q99_12385 [Gammaproteobacteria bacterium 45_16_T64]|mgnify:CR=1 FL=1|nr:hypothetical protein A9Q99_12385 [Gammaproteobacteria bacterium 45_16_T64]